MENKKEIFKILIKEFYEFNFPKIIKRDLMLPDKKMDKIITVSGPRRAGKTFYFYQIINRLKEKIPFSQILYINFEDDRLFPLSIKDLNELLEAYFELFPENKNKEVYLFFDEIQGIEGWELFIRRIYDKEKVKVFLTGSSSKLLSREIASSLRGRTLCYNLYPLSFKEFLRFKGLEIKEDSIYSKLRFRVKNLLEEFILFGSFPEVALADKNLKFQILKNYYDLIIYRDLVERFSIRNIQLLKTLMKFLITNVSSSFSVNSYYQSLESQLRVSRETILEYLSHLEEIGLIYLLPVFSYSLKVQQVNPKKVYSLDNGLRNAVSFRFSQDKGRLVENIVFQEIKRLTDDIYYWKEKGEVDFVMQKNNALTGVNVSYGKEVKERENKSLLAFKETFGRKVRRRIIITQDLEKEEEGIKFIPLWKWLLK